MKVKSGSEKWMRWKLVVKNGKCFGNAADITIRKQTEKKLSENLAYLVRINKELAEAKRLAEASVKVKQDFMANMSHEIRTPMNAIIGFTNLVLQTNLNEEQRTSLQSVKISGENLIVIINDILDFSKIEAGKMTIESSEFDLSLVLCELLKLQMQVAKDKGIDLLLNVDTKVPQYLIGDSVRVNQVLLNLLSNAVKFTSKGKVELKVKVLEEDDKEALLEFAVEDSGIGIPADKLENIFESFTQAKGDTTRKYGGTGLGLTIVKKIVDLMKGEIKVESELDKGSKFIVLVRMPKGVTKGISALQQDDCKEIMLGKLQILLAEDNELNQIFARRVLNNFGCEVDTTFDMYVMATPEPPVLSFNIPECPGDPFFLSATAEANSTIAWSGPNNFNSTLFDVTFPLDESGMGIYTAFVTSEYGCISDTSQIDATITYTMSFNDFDFPNVISANEDGSNDFLDLKSYFMTCDEFTLYIFNRWGNLVFEQGQNTAFFRGQDANGNDLEDGVYTYKLIFENYEKHGFIHVVR